MGDTPEDMAALANKAAAAGFDAAWAIELFRNAFTQTTYLGATTEEIDIGTCIAWGFVRSPMAIAMSAMDIDEISGGRFRLGLGPGVKRLIETWHNAPYGKPAPHLRETIQAVRQIIHAASAGSRCGSRVSTTTSTSEAGTDRHRPSGPISRSTPQPSREACAAWPVMSPTA